MNKAIGKVSAWLIVAGLTISVMTPVALFTNGHKVSAQVSGVSSTCECGGTYDENGFCNRGNACTAPNPYQKPALCEDDIENSEEKYRYYEIGNAGQLYWFASHINSAVLTYRENDSLVQNAKLIADITVNATLLSEDGTQISTTYADEDGNIISSRAPRDWVPICDAPDLSTYNDGVNDVSYKAGYSGTFDGCGHSISGLYNAGQSSQSYNGLFGYIGSTYNNVKVPNIINVNIKDSFFSNNVVDTYLGGIVAYAENAIMDNCSYIGIAYGENYTGGIVGQSNNSQINKCYSSGVIVTKQYGGGIVGFAKETYIENCSNTCTVTKENGVTDVAYLGGIVGWGTTNSDGNLYGCVNDGKVGCESNIVVGGIIGQSSGMKIQLCGNTGIVKGNVVGGIAGSTDSLIEKSYNDNEGTVVTYASGTTTYLGGIVAISSSAIKNCYNAGVIKDFNSDTIGYRGGIAANGGQTISNCYNISSIRNKDDGIMTGAINGNKNKLLVNCYYLSGTITIIQDDAATPGEDESTYNAYMNGTVAVATAFTSGEICYLLNGGDTNTDRTDDAWYQNIESVSEDLGIMSDSYPVLDNTHGIVYKSGSNYGLSIDNAYVRVYPSSTRYTGSAVDEPQISVYIGGDAINTTKYTVSYQKEGVAVDSSALIDAGLYEVIVEGVAPIKGTAKGTFSIVEDSNFQYPPAINNDDITHETYKGLKDGTIKGLSTDMEISKDGGVTYTKFTDSSFETTENKIVVAPGTYKIRMAKTATLDASSPTTVTINQGSALKLSEGSLIYNDTADLILTTNATQPMNLKIYNGTTLVKDIANSDYVLDEGADPQNKSLKIKNSVVKTLPIGEYQVKLVQKTSLNSNTVLVSAKLTITERTKIDNPSQPAENVDFTITDETIKGLDDGTITFKTEGLQYSRDGVSYVSVDKDTVITLEAGQYYVRYAENDIYYASDGVGAMVNEGYPFVLTLQEDGDSTTDDDVYVKQGDVNSTEKALAFEIPQNTFDIFKEGAEASTVTLNVHGQTQKTTLAKDSTYHEFTDGTSCGIYLTRGFLDGQRFSGEQQTYDITINYKKGEKTVTSSSTFSVKKITKTAPQTALFTISNESCHGLNNGRIAIGNGADGTLEYKKTVVERNYTKINGQLLENLSCGDYYIRYAETDMYGASDDSAVLTVACNVPQLTLSKVTEGNYIHGSGATYKFLTSYYSDNAVLYIDNDKLTKNTDYTVSSYNITLTNRCLDALMSNGHVLKIVYETGDRPYATCSFIVEKQTQAVPDIDNDDVTHESYSGLSDGKIANLTKDMEYREQKPNSSWSEWKKVEDVNMKFPSGTYQIRNGETDDCEPSAPVTVVVNQGQAVTIQLSKNVFTKGDTEGIVIKVNVDYDENTFKGIKVGNSVIANSNYTVKKGSTIVTLQPSYLNNLAAGTYNVAVMYKPNLDVPATFTVKSGASADETNPGGGNSGDDDSSNGGNGTNGGNGSISDGDSDNGSTSDGGSGNGTTGGSTGDGSYTGDNNTGSTSDKSNGVADNNKTDKTKGGTGARTGDNENLIYWIILAGISIIGLVVMCIISFMKKKREETIKSIKK